MSEEKAEGKERTCGNCKEELICVKIIDTFENRNTEKLQWQTKSTRKPHFKWIGENKYKCIIPTPEEKVQASMVKKPEIKKEVDTKIKVTDPFQEAELIVRWAKGKAYKIVYEEVPDINKLNDKEKNSLGQKGRYANKSTR